MKTDRFNAGYSKGNQDKRKEICAILYYILCKNIDTVTGETDYEHVYEEIMDVYSFLEEQG